MLNLNKSNCKQVRPTDGVAMAKAAWIINHFLMITDFAGLMPCKSFACTHTPGAQIYPWQGSCPP